MEVEISKHRERRTRTAEIGQAAWPVVVASLVRFDIVEIRVATERIGPPVTTYSSQYSSSEPPSYASEGWEAAEAAKEAVDSTRALTYGVVSFPFVLGSFRTYLYFCLTLSTVSLIFAYLNLSNEALMYFLFFHLCHAYSTILYVLRKFQCSYSL